MKRSLLFAFSALLVTVIAVAVALPRFLAKQNQADIVAFDPGLVLTTPTPFQPVPQTGGNPNLAPVLTDTAQPNNNCTYTQYYWLSHNDQWPGDIVVAGMSMTRDEASKLFAMTDPEPALLLTRNLYITTLNILKGADYQMIQATLNDANDWLKNFPPGQAMSEFNKSIGLSLAKALDDYNNGINGPGLCPGQYPAPTGSPASSEPFASVTPLAPGETPPSYFQPYEPPTGTPTGEPGKHHPKTPTPLPPTNPPPEPSATSAPPTDTPNPPTMTPQPPTATSIPPTGTFPPPTATPQPPTATVRPPTATSQPPTATPRPPTPTNPPPTPLPTDPPLPTNPPPTQGPTNTPLPTNTPKPTHTPKPTKSGLLLYSNFYYTGR